jgi:hypothetical protein
MEELDHETGKPLECTRNANRWVDFNENAFGGVNVNLEFAGLVNGRIEEGKQTLWVLA